MNISIAMAALTLSATCDEVYGSNCSLGDVGDNISHVCGLAKDHEGGHGGCDCGS